MKTSIPHYYHCATKGFDHSVLFSDTQEFIAGMNRIGICQAHLQETAKIIVIAFCLMDNHIHFIFYGTREDCIKWISLYHRLTMIWQKKHRDSDSIDELWEYDAWQIMDQEDLKEKIAYVFRNPTVARMGVVPGGYRWSSASLVFSDNTAAIANGRRVGKMSTYESRNLFATRTILPEDWIVQTDGMIWPGCYTDFKRVERLFGHPRAFLYSLNQSVEVDVNRQMYQGTVSLPDTDVIRMAREHAETLFRTDQFDRLDINAKIQLCKEIKKKTGASVKQMARIVRLPSAELKKIFG